MSEHERYAEELALYALDALRGEDRAHVEEHLDICAACRLELEQLRGDTALLALTTAGPRPPQRARKRLLDAVAREATAAPPTLSQRTRKDGAPAVSQTSPRRSWWGVLGWAAAAAVAVFALSLWRENLVLRQSLESASSASARNTREMEELRRIAAPIVVPEAQRVTLVSAKGPPQPQGKAFYLRNRSSLVFLANNMPALPPQKAYELWLIPVSGAPIPAGVFKPDAHGSASVVNPPLPAGAEAKAFAITVENEAGAAAPTMPIVMMGAGE
ncbi:MAG TPA: anti-sigma factor [Candidatus Dormibacteraeota bacterium]|nr:anti-sigma factor [Candidatus Dormibacteraeota bacterium]